MQEKFTDNELIQGCIANDRFYQEFLYKKYFPKMIAMCHRYTQDPDKAMDIVNNGFLKVFKKIHQFQGKGSFEGWIRRIVFHALSDYFKSENTYLKFMVFDRADREEQAKAPEQLYYDDLMKFVEELPYMSQQVFMKYAIEGYNHREIGELLGISDGTSKWHLSNARKILKSKITNQREFKRYAE